MWLNLAQTIEFKAKVLKSMEYFEKGVLSVKILALEIPPGINFSYKAGQFAMLSADEVKNPENPGQLKWSAFSIASSPYEKNLEFIIGIKTHPGVTKYIGEKVKEGSFINVRGPFGFFNLNDKSKEFVFVAIGTGIAPMISFIRALIAGKCKKPMVLFYGIRYAETFYYREELEKIAAENQNFKLMVTASREESPEWKGPKGHVQAVLKNYVTPKNKNETAIFLCGNPQMVSEAIGIFSAKGFDKCQIHAEQW